MGLGHVLCTVGSRSSLVMLTQFVCHIKDKTQIQNALGTLSRSPTAKMETLSWDQSGARDQIPKAMHQGIGPGQGILALRGSNRIIFPLFFP